MSLPEVTEEPHFDRSSFRVRGKIFATVAPDGSSINVFVDDATREMMTTVDPKAYETLEKRSPACKCASPVQKAAT